MRGLQASGKSTLARKLVQENPQLRQVNRDELRLMLLGNVWTGIDKDEKLVTHVQGAIIHQLLTSGYDVISSDTNLSERAVSFLQDIAKKCNAEVEFNDTCLSVPVDECVARDKNREKSVGEEVIRRTDRNRKRNMVKNEVRNYLKQDKTLPTTVMFDIDGTLALMNGRNPYDWKSVGSDLPNQPVVELAKAAVKSYGFIIVLSGRDECCRAETEEWLRKNEIEDFHLFMRPNKDNRKDNLVKEELFDKHIANVFNILCVYDDRKQVVDMWRKKGLLCCQVADGDF